MNRARDASRDWSRHALGLLRREAARSADTHLLHLTLPAFPGIDFYFKDESSHPSGSLKHRLARSLYLYAICNGRLQPGQRVVDASSGSTAISEAWFARLLGLEFTAVMPACTSPEKVQDVIALGGTCDLIEDAGQVRSHAAAYGAQGACFLDQFGLAERATDWRGNNNIAESILGQMQLEPCPEPRWIVCGAGTGGTSATLGRYVRYRGLGSRICVAEPAGGAFAVGWPTRADSAVARAPTCIEGIGRPRAEPGFIYEVVDDVVEVSDADSVAAAWLLRELLGGWYGGSSGTMFMACIALAERMCASGETGSIVSLLGDRGERYARTLFDPSWLATRGMAVEPAIRALRQRLGGRSGTSSQRAPSCNAAAPAGTRPVAPRR